MNIKLILFSFLLIIEIAHQGVYAQKNKSLIKQSQKHSLIISANGIYNYFNNKSLVTMVNPWGRIPNSQQVAYYWQYKYYDTYTFDFSSNYNRFFSKNFSVSAGLRLDQLKSIRKTFVYIDSSSYLPDEKKQTISRYSISAPLASNFYLKRFRFSFGLYTYVLSLEKYVYLYDNTAPRKFSDTSYGIECYAQESIAFKLFKDKGIYLQLGAFQRSRYRRNYYGYGNYFTFGLSFETPHV